MKIKRIAYYSKEREPLSLRTFSFRKYYNFKDIFAAANKANNSQELLILLQKVFSNEIMISKETNRFVNFCIDNSNFLKFVINQNDNNVD